MTSGSTVPDQASRGPTGTRGRAGTVDAEPVDLSVVIDTHNNGDVIDAFLNAVIVPDGLTSEVVVVDNASDDGPVTRVAAHAVRALVVDDPTNIGLEMR